ncbi:Uncharacterized protein YeaC [Geodia barretti]|uniref:magnesium chelatase n=1 Tax=Geodia barretti TaxID=519541 RepID=A0AA35SBL5_GEOBA|nr:Uncharacterized protein YeaC [Geodia barretti]
MIKGKAAESPSDSDGPTSSLVAADVANIASAVKASMERVLVGKGNVIELVLAAVLSGGHVLVEDVPGIGKTTLARSLAESLRCSFRRIQCTPDLMPSDITGVHFYNQKLGEFEFRPGPILAQVVLADEINRATPRTQSALLEAMAEGQLTIDDRTFPLPSPFLLIATQNPIELEGTFPLPEAQLDRFLLRVQMGYPDEDEEEQMLVRFSTGSPIDSMVPVIDGNDVVETQKKAFAAIRGREFVTPDDVKVLAPYALAHRVIVKSQARLRGRTAEDVVLELLSRVEVPV